MNSNGRPINGVYILCNNLNIRIMDLDGKMTAYDSMIIEKQIVEVKNILENYDNFFYRKDPKQELENMIAECENIFDWIKQYNE